MTKCKTFIVLVVILQLFTQLSTADCEPEAKNGKEKAAFGADILAGGLAGAAVGHLLARQNASIEVQHIRYIRAASNIGVPALTTSSALIHSIIIKKENTLANGCYKQIIKEPDVHDATRFVETELLVCPPNVPAPPSYIQQVTATSIASVLETQQLPLIPLPVPAPAENSSNTTSVHGASLVPLSPTLLERSQSHKVAPRVTTVNRHIPQPIQPEISTPDLPSFPGSVFVLSKKTGLYEEYKTKKSSADSLLAINFGIMLLIACLLRSFSI